MPVRLGLTRRFSTAVSAAPAPACQVQILSSRRAHADVRFDDRHIGGGDWPVGIRIGFEVCRIHRLADARFLWNRLAFTALLPFVLCLGMDLQYDGQGCRDLTKLIL